MCSLTAVGRGLTVIQVYKSIQEMCRVNLFYCMCPINMVCVLVLVCVCVCVCSHS